MTVVRHGNDVDINMHAEETVVICLQHGDHVTLTLHNLDPRMPHAIDLHAALVPPNQNFTPVLPGQSKTIHFVASIPGVFLYHCESDPMALHIAQGMYGAVVVTCAERPHCSTPWCKANSTSQISYRMC